MDLESLSNAACPADGLVVIYRHKGQLIVVAIVPPLVRARSLRSFSLAIQDRHANGYFPPVKIEPGLAPGSSHYFAWRSQANQLQSEVMLLVEYLRQTRTALNPIITDLGSAQT